MSIKHLLALDRLPVPPDVFDVDGRAIRHGRFARRDGSVELEAFERLELPPELFAKGPLGGPLRDPQPFREVLEAYLEAHESRPESASLVLPDAWLRATFAEVEELPRAAKARDEALRFKLRRQVPFRVEELRLIGIEVKPLPERKGARRMLLAFAIRQLVAQLEEVFGSLGIRIGYVSSRSLSVLPGVVDRLGALDLAALAFVGTEGYSLVFTRSGEPALLRFKPINGRGDEAAWERLVERDLKLTKTYLDEQMPGERLRRIVLVAGRDREPRWRERLEEAFSVPVSPVDAGWAAMAELDGGPDLDELAPLAGAASRDLR